MGLELLFQGSNIERLLNGLWVTAEIAFVSVFFACILGVIFGVIMTSRNPIIKAICRFYLEFVRIIPLLALLFLAYFGLAKWFDIHLDGISVCILVFIFFRLNAVSNLCVYFTSAKFKTCDTKCHQPLYPHGKNQLFGDVNWCG